MKVSPIGDKNAIVAVAFAIEFESPLSEAVFAAAEQLHKRSNDDDDLPGVVHPQEVEVVLGAGNDIHAKKLSGHGITFQNVAPDGAIQWSLSFHKQAAVVLCTRYTHWKEIYSKANSLFEKYLPLALENNAITAVVLEYKDRFTVANPSEPWLPELFNVETDYLPKAALQQKKAWHMHTGYMRDDEPGNVSILSRANIDYSIEGDNGVVTIVTSHKFISLKAESDEEEHLNHELDVIYDRLHKENKKLFSDLLTPEMKEKIDLVDC